VAIYYSLCMLTLQSFFNEKTALLSAISRNNSTGGVEKW
jgi:hypothetical protein